MPEISITPPSPKDPQAELNKKPETTPSPEVTELKDQIENSPTAPGKKTVEIDAAVLTRLLDTVEAQKADIEDLKQAADVGRLTRIQNARQSGKLVKSAKLSVFEGKVVLAWKSVKDDVWVDERGRIHEDQQIALYLDNGKGNEPTESRPLSLSEFNRLVTKVQGEVIREAVEADGQKFLTVMLADGRQFELSIVFVN